MRLRPRIDPDAGGAQPGQMEREVIQKALQDNRSAAPRLEELRYKLTKPGWNRTCGASKNVTAVENGLLTTSKLDPMGH